MQTNSKWLVPILLILALGVGMSHRLVGINWDDFTHLHPDERFLTQVVSSLGGDLNLSSKSDGEIGRAHV